MGLCPESAGPPIYRELVADEGLTAQTSTFTRRDVLRAVAERLPAGAPVHEIEQVADAVLARDPDQIIALGATRGRLTGLDVIRRTDGRPVAADPAEPRFTTRGLLLLEQHAASAAAARDADHAGLVPAAAVDAAIGGRGLSDEQTALVRALTGSGRGVEVVVGKAGTGKTYTLDAARQAWQTAGIRVVGVALAARAALELQHSAGIRSTTLTRLLAAAEHPRGSWLPPGGVLVVDEAGMVGTRPLARLLAHAADRQVKVVLVGDPHQLPEIDAGGLFTTLTRRLPTLELTANRRQAHRWEADALDELRDGDPATAVADRQAAQLRAELAGLPDPDTVTAAHHEHTRLDRRLDDLADTRVRHAQHHPPRHLTVLGPPPTDPTRRHLWRQAATTIEAYRLRWNITDPDRPLGGPATDPHQQRHRQLAAHRIELTFAELTRAREHDTPDRHIGLAR